MPTKIIIDRTYRDGENKKYQSTEQQIERNRRENEAQARRDEAARQQAVNDQNSSANRNAYRG